MVYWHISQQITVSVWQIIVLPTQPLWQWMLSLYNQIPFLFGHVGKSRCFQQFIPSSETEGKKPSPLLITTAPFCLTKRQVVLTLPTRSKVHFSPRVLHASTWRMRPKHSCRSPWSLSHVPQSTPMWGRDAQGWVHANWPGMFAEAK